MPPKKDQQQPVNALKPFYVLPLFINDSPQHSEPYKILKNKPINIKKCIDKTKIIQILKDKGLAQHLTLQGQIKPEGRKFICQNFKTVLQQATIEAPKITDKKAPQPKKKGLAAEIPIQDNKQPTVELTMDKKCDNFVFLLDFPQTSDQLKACIENGLKIDAVIVIEEKIKKGSNPPNYDLLGKNYDQNELMSTLNGTKIKEQPRMQKAANQQQQVSRTNSSKKILKTLRRIKNENPDFSNLIITDVPFEKDISHPQNNETDFINSAFTKLCSTTVQKQQYENWLKNNVKKVPMIQPLKEIVKKQVLLQQQKTGGKKDANKEPEYETVEEVIQTAYESLPQNIKSDLKTYKQFLQIRPKNHQDSIKTLVQNCLLSVEHQLGRSNQSILQVNPETTFQKLTSKPLAKVNFINSLKQNLRKVQPFSKAQLTHNLIHQPKQIQEKVNLAEILHKYPSQTQTLESQFIMKTFTDFMRQQEPKLKWNFSDRVYKEKLSKVQVLSQIQKQLLRDPKIYQFLLKQDNIKLLCMAKINPPGRVLYSNDIFQQKAVPDFQIWMKRFKSSQDESNQFFNYKFEEVGNLSMKRQKLTPTDNVMICDEKVSIGNEVFKINNFEKFGTFYGLKQANQEKNEFWLKNTKQQLSLSIFQHQHEFKKTSTITETVKEEGSSEQQKVEKIVESIQTQKRVQMWFRTDQFTISHTPYPTINWLSQNRQTRSGQMRRQFGPKGQITSYLNDGSVRIFYLNGNISTFRNNQWQRVVSNQLIINNGSNRKLEIKQFTEGDKTIRVREDQTIFIEYSNGNTLIIFSDDTKVLHKKKQNISEIRTFNSQFSEEIIVRLTLPKNSEVNIIGHGSAFAYLGFKNLLERSVDGFLYEVWHNKFSTHLYNEKYEYENKIYEDEIRLVHLQDGSLIKVEANDNISFVQGDYDLSQEKLSQKWNQAFALEQNHQVGVYDIHLTQGTIKTKDAESNCFKIHVEEQNEIDIAVSFKISEDDKITNHFESGFHVPEENYFLPAPDNSLPPRIFTLDNVSHEFYEYLTPQQVREMQVSSSIQHTESYSIGSKIIQQYTKQVRKNGRFEEDKKVVAFSKAPLSREYEIPGILLPRQSRVSMNVQNEKILFRCIEKIEWNEDFQNITKITQDILKQKELRLKELQVGRS